MLSTSKKVINIFLFKQSIYVYYITDRVLSLYQNPWPMANKFFYYGRGLLAYPNYTFAHKMFMCIGECFFLNHCIHTR